MIFLRKLQPGGAEHSFGIHVAKMAGIPSSVVQRADEILAELEQKTISKDLQNRIKKIPAREMQLSIFSAEDPELKKIKEWLSQFDPNTLTPIEALMKLMEIKDKMKGSGFPRKDRFQSHPRSGQRKEPLKTQVFEEGLIRLH